MDFLNHAFIVFQILLIDIALTADNAIAVSLVVAGLPAKDRARSTVLGLIIATFFRVIFSLFAVQLLKISGLLVAGGFLLLWVCWKLYEEIKRNNKTSKLNIHNSPKGRPAKTFAQAIVQIAIADISMSLDNVLAVAGVSKGETYLLLLGLILSVALMGFAAGYLARLMSRLPWLQYLGLISILYSAFSMIYEGWHSLTL